MEGSQSYLQVNKGGRVVVSPPMLVKATHQRENYRRPTTAQVAFANGTVTLALPLLVDCFLAMGVQPQKGSRAENRDTNHFWITWLRQEPDIKKLSC